MTFSIEVQMKFFAGIDPGLDGCLCLILPDGKVEFRDVPTFTIKSGKKQKRKYNIPAMAELLAPLQKRFQRVDSSGFEVLVALELVHAMPGQGVTSMFSMGHGLGIWEGLLAAFRIPFQFVTPQRWKKLLMDGQGQDKDASRQIAMRLFPAQADRLNLKKHHNRADALLLAEYLRRTGLPERVEVEEIA